MNANPLHLYLKCTRLVFNVEPSEEWKGCEEFERNLRHIYLSVLCRNCNSLLIEPVIPKKQNKSCQHRVCLDCIGMKRSTTIDCKMCSDYTLFEKSQSTKLLLQCFRELCELVRSSWIYDFIQRRTNHDTGQCESPSLTEIIDSGINYGQVSIVIDETSSDENSNSSETSKEPLQSISYSSQVFPNISPLSPVKMNVNNVQSSPEQFTIISEPVIPHSNPVAALPIVSSPPLVSLPQIVQYQPQIASTSNLQQSPTANFIKYPSPMRTSAAPMGSKPIMAPMKIQQQTFSSPTPTIYSVMYTGSGNKITLKRKPPDDSELTASPNKMAITKTENTMNSSFKRPPLQLATTPHPQNQSPTPISAANVTTTSGTSPNDPTKRRGCRCGNATAAPGKLTCCGQRCPCYVDSKACIDCKCKGCRNPHYVDGHKKMRHQVPDVKTQQQQQQSFLASIQQQTTMVKDIQKSVIPSTSVIKPDDFNLMDQTALISRAPTSISNCIISMNSNGQYQIKQSHPRIIVKDQGKTMGPLIFPGNTAMLQPVVTTMGSLANPPSAIQIVGVYSQVQMEKKIIKNDQPAVMSFADTSKSLLERTSAFNENNLNSNLL